MEPAIEIVVSTLFGAVSSLPAFIRQLLSSRNEAMHAKAYHRRFSTDLMGLTQMHQQIDEYKQLARNFPLDGEANEKIGFLEHYIFPTSSCVDLTRIVKEENHRKNVMAMEAKINMDRLVQEYAEPLTV